MNRWEVMEGMGEGLFSPNTAVKRSQMAVMLSRTVDKTNYTFEKNKITAVDTENKTITATNSKGKETQYTYTDKYKLLKSLGDKIQASRLVSGVECGFVKSGNTLVSATLYQGTGQNNHRQICYLSVKSGVVSIKISFSDDSEENETYECASNISVTYDGSPQP